MAFRLPICTKSLEHLLQAKLEEVAKPKPCIECLGNVMFWEKLESLYISLTFLGLLLICRLNFVSRGTNCAKIVWTSVARCCPNLLSEGELFISWLQWSIDKNQASFSLRGCGPSTRGCNSPLPCYYSSRKFWPGWIGTSPWQGKCNAQWVCWPASSPLCVFDCP